MSNSYLAQPDTLEQLKRAVADSDFMAMNTIDISLAELMQAEERELGFSAISTIRQQYLATYNAEGYVNGEGFDALFRYMSDQEFDSMLLGFEQYQASELLKLIHKAIKKFPKSPPLPTQTAREQTLDVWEDKEKNPFEKLDGEFMKLGSAMNQRMRFVLANSDPFFIQ